MKIKKISISLFTLIIAFNALFSCFVPIIGFADKSENSDYSKKVNLDTSNEEIEEHNQQYNQTQLSKNGRFASRTFRSLTNASWSEIQQIRKEEENALLV